MGVLLARSGAQVMPATVCKLKEVRGLPKRFAHPLDCNCSLYQCVCGASVSLKLDFFCGFAQVF
jgi:hypothetical protein